MTQIAEEKCLLKFADQFNYGFTAQSSNPGFEFDEDRVQKMFDVKRDDGKTLKYNVYMINEPTPSKRKVTLEKDRFSILVREVKTKVYHLFVRGSNEFMENIIDFGLKASSYKRIIRANKEAGLRSLVFGRKTLEESKVFEIVDQYKKIVKTSLDIESDLEALIAQLECNLKFCCVVGLRNSLKEDAMATVDQFKAMGVKTHMLTGDIFENAINTSVSLKMIPSSSSCYTVLDFADEVDGQAKIQEVLDRLKTQLSKRRPLNDELKSQSSTFGQFRSSSNVGINRSSTLSKDNLMFSQYFVVSGRTMEAISKNKYLYTHFTFILQFAQSIVGYDMKPLHKGLLIKLMKDADSERNVMSIGDGFNDVSMMQQSDISFQVANELTQLIYGDVVVKDLSVIPLIMCRQGFRYNSNLNLAVFGSFYNSITVTCILFFFQFYCNFTSTAIIQTGLFYGTTSAYSFLCVFYVLLEDRFGGLVSKDIPAIYVENIYFNNMHLRHFFTLVLSCLLVHRVDRKRHNHLLSGDILHGLRSHFERPPAE